MVEDISEQLLRLRGQALVLTLLVNGISIRFSQYEGTRQILINCVEQVDLQSFNTYVDQLLAFGSAQLGEGDRALLDEGAGSMLAELAEALAKLEGM